MPPTVVNLLDLPNELLFDILSDVICQEAHILQRTCRAFSAVLKGINRKKQYSPAIKWRLFSDVEEDPDDTIDLRGDQNLSFHFLFSHKAVYRDQVVHLVKANLFATLEEATIRSKSRRSHAKSRKLDPSPQKLILKLPFWDDAICDPPRSKVTIVRHVTHKGETIIETKDGSPVTVGHFFEAGRFFDKEFDSDAAASDISLTRRFFFDGWRYHEKECYLDGLFWTPKDKFVLG